VSTNHDQQHQRDSDATNASDSESVSQFLEALGSAAPTPGGGAASAMVGATAAALCEMVAHFTVGRQAYAAVEGRMTIVIQEAGRLRGQLLALAEEDERGYAAVTAAYRQPKSTAEEQAARAAAVQAALATAMRAPLQMMERTCAALELAVEVAESGNVRLASDAGCAALLGEAAVRAAGLNVLANVVLMPESPVAADARRRVSHYTGLASRSRERVMRLVDPQLESNTTGT
jgi:formiminotetrahydrofolate cyclodeaminase